MTRPESLLRSNYSYSHHQILPSRPLLPPHPTRHPESLSEEAGVPLHVTGVPEQSVSSPWKIENLLDHVHNHLRPRLLDTCMWLEQEALEIDTERPINAGGAADVWVGRMGDRYVVVKSYRYYSSSSYLPTCNVSRTHTRSERPLSHNMSAEIPQRGASM